ncbi:MAG: hypothetical protein LBC56_00345 [Oscillospiraceae bacterium]|jgi:hypothetical protein|nr:hypothetical protein [Oscillospiraceae bacterium]
MKKYYIDFNSGTNVEITKSLDSAMDIADAGAGMSREHINIICQGRIVAVRKWHEGMENLEHNKRPITFPPYGYYKDWKIKY